MANRKALDNFSNLTNYYKGNFIGWITSAKREETRKRRLAESIRLLEQNKELEMKWKKKRTRTYSIPSFIATSTAL